MKLTILKILKIGLIILLFTSLFILSFHTPLRNLISIYTYYGLFMLIIFTILLCIILFLIHKQIKFDIKDCIISILLCFFINLFFFCMVPVSIERSISIFMLHEMENEAYTKKEIEDIFIQKYIYKYQAFEKRLYEQQKTGTINQINDQYYLNKKGEKLLKKFRFIKKIYHIQTPLLQ